MIETRLIMGMPIKVEVRDSSATEKDLNDVFDYFGYIDGKFSAYKPKSEISLINNNKIAERDYSRDMKEVLRLSDETRKLTDGYFNIEHNGQLDPSGLVKGWAIRNAAAILKNKGFGIYYIDAGGDIQAEGRQWRIGIRSPFKEKEIVKVVGICGCGIATSGTYNRGDHIYNPKAGGRKIEDIASVSIIGPDVYEADRIATAVFAMGRKGIDFLAKLPDFAGYMIDNTGRAVYTSSFGQYVL